MSMDSPPECVLVLSCDPLQTSPTLPSLDHSPLPLQLTPPSLDQEEEDEEQQSVPSSPPHGGSLGFGVLEQALWSSQDPHCSAELDLQLFNNGGEGGEADGAPLRFPCEVCGKRFRFNSILSLHARAHALERDRQNQSQSQNQNQNQNQNQSPVVEQEIPRDATPLTPPLTEEAPPYGPTPTEDPCSPVLSSFRCHACKGKFRTASELSRHVRILHNPYKCSMCAFSANQEEALALHLQQSHPAPSSAPGPTPGPAPLPLPAFRCETCGQRFTQSWFLKGHMRKHKASLDHKCQVCGRGFKEPWFLKNHMKVHLNKLGLKAGGAVGGRAAEGGAAGGGAGDHGKASPSSQAFGALYSSLLLSRVGGASGRAGGGARMGPLDAADPSKASLLGYLGLPGDGGGSCMERLQAVAQVAERGGASAGGGAMGTGGGAAVWHLVARSLASGQQGQQRAQKSSVAGEAEQVRAYLGGLLSGGHTPAPPWECPDCGKLFRSLQQAVVHARVHVQRPHREEPRKPTHAPKPPTPPEQPAGFHSTMSHTQGENGLRGGSGRERVRGTGVKDCPYCGKAFRSSHHLKVHLRVHTGERPYKCPHCDYAGTQSGSLKYHLQRHHREQRGSVPPLPSQGPIVDPSPRHAQAWPQGVGGRREHRVDGASLEGFPYTGGAMVGGYPSPAPPKLAKASRRKPLTTTRLLPPPGFEPLDLSRRPALPGCEVTLNQCLFCPFRTSSTELMAMHLQVNHTSKSRRKQPAPYAPPDPAPDPLAFWTSWRDNTPQGHWPTSRAAAANGFLQPGEGPVPEPVSSAGNTNQHEEEEEAEEEEEEEGEEEEEEIEGEGDIHYDDCPRQEDGMVLSPMRE